MKQYFTLNFQVAYTNMNPITITRAIHLTFPRTDVISVQHKATTNTRVTRCSHNATGKAHGLMSESQYCCLMYMICLGTNMYMI